MADSEVEWALDTVRTHWPDGSYPDDLVRVNRDDSTRLDGSPRSHTEDLQAANFVGAATGDRSTEAVGTSYKHRVETVVDIRVEGLDETEYGHVADAAAFKQLYRGIRGAIESQRSYPSVGVGDITYHSLIIDNEDDRSSRYGDYYEYRLSVRFLGYEDL